MTIANGLTIGPDGDLYYTDFGNPSGAVWRVNESGQRTRVSTNAIAGANGLAFGADGSLFVNSYVNGTVFRLTLTNNMESGRETAATGVGSADGLALDAMGNLYVGSMNMGLLRVAPDGEVTRLATISGATNVEFGAGALRCTDIYVATGAGIRRYEMGTIPGADVPWHR
jgi:sugar lactone lactonase YvrE